MNKIIALAIVTVAIVGGGLFATTRAFAQNSDNVNPMSALVTRIAEKFGLNKDEVQTVVDDFHNERRQQMQATMQARMEERLTALVSEGKITEDQKKAILAKHEELRNTFNPDGFANMSPEERKAKMQEKHDELEKWAESQNINLEEIGFGFGFRGVGHMGGKFMWK